MHYWIRVKGHLGPSWAEWFAPWTITNVECGETVLDGEIADQSALHGVLIKIRDLGLPLISVQQRSADDVSDEPPVTT
jgi:hypothetical protein